LKVRARRAGFALAAGCMLVWGCEPTRKRAVEVELGSTSADGGTIGGAPADARTDTAVAPGDARADAGGASDSRAAGDGPVDATGAPVDCSVRTAVGEDISQNVTWKCGVYELTKKVWVLAGATLTIEAGTTVVAGGAALEAPGLFVARGGKLLARGQRGRPIVFTSGKPAGARAAGDWAGIALFGAARINTGRVCAGGMPGCLETVPPGFPASEAKAFFGGLDDGSSCGELDFVRIEFAGAPIDQVTEFNALTVAGCGSATKIRHLQVHRATDDGIELLGGTAALDHLVISGIEDDAIDWNMGWRGTAQFVAIFHHHAQGDNGIECASKTGDELAEPRSAPRIANVTMISNGSRRHRAITFKEGTLGKMRNLIVQGFTFDVVNFMSTTTNLSTVWPSTLSIEHSFFWGNGAYQNDPIVDDDLSFPDQMAVEDPARNNRTDIDPQLASPDPSAPNFVPMNEALNDVTGPDFGDTSASFAGAFKPRDPTPWTADWTAYPQN
jgi:hypothetical protein